MDDRGGYPSDEEIKHARVKKAKSKRRSERRKEESDEKMFQETENSDAKCENMSKGNTQEKRSRKKNIAILQAEVEKEDVLIETTEETHAPSRARKKRREKNRDESQDENLDTRKHSEKSSRKVRRSSEVHEAVTDSVEHKPRRKTLSHLESTSDIGFRDEKSKSRTKRSNVKQLEMQNPVLDQSSEAAEYFRDRRKLKSAVDYEDAKFSEEHSGKSRKKSKKEHLDMTDTGYCSQNFEDQPVKHKKKKKTKERESFRQEQDNELDDPNAENERAHWEDSENNDDESEQQRLSKMHGPGAVIHPSRVVRIVSKPLNISDHENGDCDSNENSSSSKSAKQSVKASPKTDSKRTKKTKRRGSYVDDTLQMVGVSDEEKDGSELEPLKPPRNGSYLDNNPVKQNSKSPKKSKALIKSRSVDQPNYEPHPESDLAESTSKLHKKSKLLKKSQSVDEPERIEERSRKKSSISRLAQMKKERGGGSPQSAKSQHDSDNTDTPSPKPKRAGRSKRVIDSDDEYSHGSRHNSVSKKLPHDDNDHVGSEGQRPLKSTVGGSKGIPVTQKRENVTKTSIMPFRLSDESSSEEEDSNRNTGDAPRLVNEATKSASSRTKKKPPVVIQDTLFDGFGEESQKSDVSNTENSSDQESSSEEITPPPKKNKKHKTSQKEETSPKDKRKMINKLYASSLSSSPKLSKTDKKPPRPERKSVHGYPHPQRSESPSGSVGSHVSWQMKGIFSIEGHTYDVFMKDDRLTWNCVKGSSKVPKSRRKSYVRRISESSMASLETSDTDEMNTMYYRDLLGVTVRRDNKKGHKEGGGVCLGISLFTYVQKEGNRLKVREIHLDHPSESECVKWVERLHEYLQEFEERPRRMKVFVQPYAGKKQSMMTYQTSVMPLFHAAGIDVDMIQVNHNEHIKQEMTHLKLEDYDCIVCVGGDGTVSRVVNHILSRQQERNGVEMTVHLTPLKAEVKLGVIPTGMTNQIVQSIQGVADAATSAIHIVMGACKPTDVCSIFEDEQFFRWAFMCHYGYFANTLAYVSRPAFNVPLPIVPGLPHVRYSIFGEKKLEAAFVKALTKSKLRAYECEIKYIPVSKSEYGTPMDERVCNEQCRRCNTDLDASSCSTFSDEIEQLGVINDSDSSDCVELKENTQWKTLKGQFLNVSLLAIPGRGEYSPLGMSKYSHLTNGCLDLILVNDTSKKEFTRFLKRHGNNKNQLALPFVQSLRCKEVQFMLRLKNTWKHTDHGFNEIDYELEKAERLKQDTTEGGGDGIEVVGDLGDNAGSESETEDSDSDSDSDSEDATVKMFSIKRTKSNKDKKEEKRSRRKSSTARPKQEMNPEVIDDDSDVSSVNEAVDYNSKDGEDTTSEGKKTNEKKGHKRQASMSSTKSKPSKSESKEDYVAPPKDYIIDQDRKRRQKKRAKKDQKKKEKEERRMRSYWNLDNELYHNMNLHVRVHRGLITIYGAGVKKDYEPSEVKMGCLSVF